MAAHEPDHPGGEVSIDLWRESESLGRVRFRNIDGVSVAVSRRVDELLAHPKMLRLVKADGRAEP